MTNLERRMQHKRLQALCTKIVGDTVKLKGKEEDDMITFPAARRHCLLADSTLHCLAAEAETCPALLYRNNCQRKVRWVHELITLVNMKTGVKPSCLWLVADYSWHGIGWFSIIVIFIKLSCCNCAGPKPSARDFHDFDSWLLWKEVSNTSHCTHWWCYIIWSSLFL